eukprot:c6059_g1_i1.p1 GENE.c6059_g1_i1~~c6059_g1_i1.p1  ORF type:complete len:129 (+),score=50.34 c6059_g1_i1:24-389(+)
MTSIFHMLPVENWKNAPEEYYPPTYQQDGFVHCASTAEELVTIGNHFYKTVSGDFLILVLEISKLKSEVKFEPPAAVGNFKPHTDTQLFPHIYGPINKDSVTAIKKLVRDETGTFLSVADL